MENKNTNIAVLLSIPESSYMETTDELALVLELNGYAVYNPMHIMQKIFESDINIGEKESGVEGRVTTTITDILDSNIATMISLADVVFVNTRGRQRLNLTIDKYDGKFDPLSFSVSEGSSIECSTNEFDTFLRNYVNYAKRNDKLVLFTSPRWADYIEYEFKKYEQYLSKEYNTFYMFLKKDAYPHTKVPTRKLLIVYGRDNDEASMQELGRDILREGAFYNVSLYNLNEGIGIDFDFIKDNTNTIPDTILIYNTASPALVESAIISLALDLKIEVHVTNWYDKDISHYYYADSNFNIIKENRERYSIKAYQVFRNEGDK